ncbi:MAG: MBL fold metallo-hydrolase [Verrucomicrobiota bacterium]
MHPTTTTPSEPVDANVVSPGPSPRVLRIRHLIVNSYLVGDPGTSSWVVVDAGLSPFCARRILAAAEKRFGAGVPPAAIVLTHGHFDHVGGVHQLLARWDVPVYAHLLELPYLTGRASYPPPDPTVGGGLLARLGALFPSKGINLGERVRPLPGDGVVPGMTGWRWIHTPGHSPGHVSFFRFTDRVLLAGDAFVTTKQESLLSVLTQFPQVSRPPAYFTPNWGLAERSLETLLALEPEVAATGHGVPICGERLRSQLKTLVNGFRKRMPSHGRYVNRPALADETGVVTLPPPVHDPFPRMVGLGVMMLAAVALGIHLGRAHRSVRDAESPGRSD